MLTKNNELDIPKENPFVNDKLQRKIIAENLTQLVQSTNQPFVISVEAPWGWGKTTFVKMWKTHLESLGHTCIYFNAWENDFVDDPLIAFIGEISKALDEKKTKGNAEKQFKRIQNIGGKIVRRLLPLTIQLATQGLLTQDSVKGASNILFTGSDEIANLATELAEEKIKQYENDKNGIREFKKELTKFAKLISEDKSKKAPLIFFIDELDRSRPDFSISLLERIKHIFNAEGIVFVLSIDRGQIEQSVKSIYGQEMKSDGYLRRFIDFRVRLPEPSIESFCVFLFEHFKLDEVFEKRNKRNNEQETLMKFFIKLSHLYGFSLRVIEQCFTEINLILRTTSPTTNIFPEILAFLISIRAYKPEIYAQLSVNPMSSEQAQKIIKEIKQDFDLKDRSISWLLSTVEAHITYSYLNEKDQNSIYESYSSIIKDESSSKSEKEYFSFVMNFIQEFELRNRYPKAIQFIKSRLDAIENIMA